MFGVGLATLWLSLLVFIPLGAVVWRGQQDGIGLFWDAATTPEAAAAIRLTVGDALLVALVNAVLGTMIAWILVRDEFPGKRVLDALIDLPFALPTIVAGLVLLTLYGVQSPARARVGLHPRRCRRRAAVRHAALRRAHSATGVARTRHGDGAGGNFAGRRQVHERSGGSCCPICCRRSLPAPPSAFARAISEFGSTVLISGNLPFKTQVASVHIFNQIQNDNTVGAAAVATVLLIIALMVLLGLDLLQRWASRHA